MRCIAKTHENKQCGNQAAEGTVYCRIHIRQKSFDFDKKKNDRARAAWIAWNKTFIEDDVPMPEICRTLVCGAKTRAGTPCRRRDLYNNGRCKLHGGMSTGPKTKQGKDRSCRNLPWAKCGEGQ